MTSDHRLRAVGIGAGYFSKIQYEAWQRIPQVDMVAIADLDADKARTVAQEFDIPGHYVDYREMIAREDPDVVDIITPPHNHYDLCTYAAERGIHVICQKPLAPTYEVAEQIVREVNETGVRFMIHENWRWQPWFREVKKLSEEGVLGELFSLSFCMRTGDGWTEDAYLDRQPYFRDYTRFLMFEIGVHFVDTFRFLLGEVETVYARLRRLNPVIKGEDSAHVVFGFTNGATAVLDSNRYNEMHADDDPRYTFGTMRIDGSKAHLILKTDGSIEIKPLGGEAYEHTYAHVDRGLAGDSAYHLQNHFVQAFFDGTPFESSGEDYLKTLQVVEACYESAALDDVMHRGGEPAGAFRTAI